MAQAPKSSKSAKPAQAAARRSAPRARRGASALASTADNAAPVAHPPTAAAHAAGSPLPPIEIEVLNGNLMFVRPPLMIGHYRSTQLTGSEAVVNGLLGGTMAESLAAGVYPDSPANYQMFRNTGAGNPWQLPRPEWAIVVGLGDESDLQQETLVHTVRQAVIGWAQRLNEDGQAQRPFELASTLIASGGTRVMPGATAQLIARAAHEANQRLAASGWPLLARLTLVELYLDRASEAWRALHVLAAARPAHWRVADQVRIGTGALLRTLDSGYRGTDYDLISASSSDIDEADAQIAYSLDTRRARTEVRAAAPHPLQGPGVESLAAAARRAARGARGSRLLHRAGPVRRGRRAPARTGGRRRRRARCAPGHRRAARP